MKEKTEKENQSKYGMILKDQTQLSALLLSAPAENLPKSTASISLFADQYMSKQKSDFLMNVR